MKESHHTYVFLYACVMICAFPTIKPMKWFWCKVYSFVVGGVFLLLNSTVSSSYSHLHFHPHTIPPSCPTIFSKWLSIWENLWSVRQFIQSVDILRNRLWSHFVDECKGNAFVSTKKRKKPLRSVKVLAYTINTIALLTFFCSFVSFLVYCLLLSGIMKRKIQSLLGHLWHEPKFIWIQACVLQSK